MWVLFFRGVFRGGGTCCKYFVTGNSHLWLSLERHRAVRAMYLGFLFRTPCGKRERLMPPQESMIPVVGLGGLSKACFLASVLLLAYPSL